MACGYNNMCCTGLPQHRQVKTPHIFHDFVKTVDGFMLLGRTTWQIPEISQDVDTILSELEGN